MIRPASDELLEMLHTYDPALGPLALAAREALMSREADCWELIYHTYALSTAFSLTEHLKDAFCHVAVYRQHVNLGFNRGAELDDPTGLLKGTGKLIRHVRLGPNLDLASPPVASLIDQAVNNSMRRLVDRKARPTPGAAVVKQDSPKRR